MDPDDMVRALTASLAFPQEESLRPAWRWTHATPKDRIQIPCEDCGRRIAWWTAKLRSGWLGLQDASHRGWKWHGEVPPIRFRGPLVDAACPSCGWAKFGAARQPEADWQLAAPEIL